MFSIQMVQSITRNITLALSDFFTESTYIAEQNKTMPCYMVTKKGCEFIVHKLTAIGVIAFIVALVATGGWEQVKDIWERTSYKDKE